MDSSSVRCGIMVAVRKELEICLGRGSTKIPLLTELRACERDENRLAEWPHCILAIPTGLWPPAQGCEARATLGYDLEMYSTATRLRQIPDGNDSIPNIFLVPFDLMLAQQRPQLVLKSNLAMMLLLAGDVLLHRFEIGLAHGKICITTLLLEVRVIATAFLQPDI